jgi:hypothetical protein
MAGGRQARPGRPLRLNIRDKNRRHIGKSQSKWNAFQDGNARLTLGGGHPGAACARDLRGAIGPVELVVATVRAGVVALAPLIRIQPPSLRPLLVRELRDGAAAAAVRDEGAPVVADGRVHRPRHGRDGRHVACERVHGAIDGGVVIVQPPLQPRGVVMMLPQGTGGAHPQSRDKNSLGIGKSIKTGRVKTC